ncbi:MAG: NAD(P)-dependent alcohol dehydrogenase [Candidatus Thiodiazotropha sp. (ex Ctena orbiculata)]|uniref:NAD(P)-dependent alcohol dehydrogenase n=1 Tax=Candidatus Thiodiazotropha taylori TaxID=2792791 RepID=A0A944MFD4_9GAMM|nr:NAD(P)-dependent alcohol dehydrogenase [Candidatus Thiodiazotropha taylori]MBV2136122.1 NAD(P)-dependent alcohol dehydrogenase [Candidatus Thiodiazotropha taylori]
MKAIAFTRYGSPDALQLVELPKPEPKDDELLIRVHASSVNSWDWEFLTGTVINRLFFGLFKPHPDKRVLGADIAGTVEAVGGKVTRFKPGDEVFGDLWDSWGGFAEYASAPENAMEAKPQGTTFENAAAVPQAGVLALQGIRKIEQLKSGQQVLINGAGGGVGTFAIQLAKLAGTEVTGVDAAHKLDVAKSVGADRVVDYSEQDFTQTGERYDLIIDCQGTHSIADCKRALVADGTYAMIGGTKIIPVLMQQYIAPIFGEQKRFRLVADGPNKGLADLKSLIEEDKIILAIDKIYPLEEVPEAMGYFGEGLHKGKIVIRVKSD